MPDWPQNIFLTPTEKAFLHIQAVLAATDILPAPITPTWGHPQVLFRIQVITTVAAIFSAQIANGAFIQVANFNSGVALVANAAYIFDLLVHDPDTINFRLSVGGNITLRVQEILAGVS